MIGWSRCSDCINEQCRDEDDCQLAPKNIKVVDRLLRTEWDDWYFDLFLSKKKEEK